MQVETDASGNEVVLGQGQLGVVVKGSYQMAPVAIKRLNGSMPDQRGSFLKEMAILKACRGSRYIVSFVGACLKQVNTVIRRGWIAVEFLALHDLHISRTARNQTSQGLGLHGPSFTESTLLPLVLR